MVSAGVREEILRQARESGACAAGFAAVNPLPALENERLAGWIESGRNATMDYMARYADIRSDARLLLEGARTVLSVAFSFRQPEGRRHPLISDYALGDDYHDAIRRRLEPVSAAMEAFEGTTRICVDTAPVRERYWAVKAGIGFIGLSNLLIVPGVGPKVFLAEIFWTADAGVEDAGVAPEISCGECRRCVRACPGKALDGKGGLDARRCLSYLTIEHRGDFEHVPGLGGRKIFGCDVCQDACPHGRETCGVDMLALPEFRMRPELADLRTPEDVAGLTQERFSAIFRRSAVKRTKLAGLQRNAMAASEHGKTE